jgi:hypothetical protein
MDAWLIRSLFTPSPKAIRTGVNPGRFLKKGDDGKWQTVSDKEAAWKVSQALREKTRWSSLKEETADDKPNSPTPATVKRSAVDADTIFPPKKKVKSEKSAIQLWTPGEVIFGFRVLRNYLTLHSITLLINDQYDGHSIKLV